MSVTTEVNLELSQAVSMRTEGEWRRCGTGHRHWSSEAKSAPPASATELEREEHDNSVRSLTCRRHRVPRASPRFHIQKLFPHGANGGLGDEPPAFGGSGSGSGRANLATVHTPGSAENVFRGLAVRLDDIAARKGCLRCLRCEQLMTPPINAVALTGGST